MVRLGRPMLEGQDHQDNCQHQRCRGRVTTQFQAAATQRLVEEIANHRAQWPAQDESGQEQHGMRDSGVVIRQCNGGQQASENDRAGQIT